MHFTQHSLCIFVITLKSASCFYNLCHSHKNTVVSDDECSELFFEPGEKETDLGDVKLDFREDSLTITPTATTWINAFVKVTMHNNQSNQFCSKLTPTASKLCITFKPDALNQTFLLEYKSEKLPETSSRKFLFAMPLPEQFPLFPYVDQTDSSRLILKAQRVRSAPNTTYYKVEAYKEHNNVTTFQDLKMFNSNEDISYEFFTYNDEGNYFFVVHVMNKDCLKDLCLTVTTPKVYIGRKSTRLVIGIVGASFILPFVLFLFHVLTKRYPNNEANSPLSTRIIVTYKSSFKKHNEVVLALASLLEKLTKNESIVVDAIDLSKSVKKFPEKFCIDSIYLADRVVYVAPPVHDANQIAIDKTIFEKDVLAVVFDHCTDKLPHYIEPAKVFKLFEDFERFVRALDVSEPFDNAVYADLKLKTEEAKIETEQYLDLNAVPQIVVTDSEPHEYDSLMEHDVL